MKTAKIQNPDTISHAPENPAISFEAGGAVADMQALIIQRLNAPMQAEEQTRGEFEAMISTLSRLASIPALALSAAAVISLIAWIA